MSLDPLANKYSSWSPYSYVFGNPLKYIDPDGKEPTPEALQRAADKLGVDVASIRAVWNSESSTGNYFSDGKLKILYERHYFRKFTNGEYNESHPDLSGPQGNYGYYSEQYDKFERAKLLDKDAAYRSISVGGFQIMGNNYESVGYNSAEEFVEAMFVSTDDEQLEAFTNYILNSKRQVDGQTKLDALRKKDWTSFAKNYNGPSYATNDYDGKMKRYYNMYKDDPFKGLDNGGSWGEGSAPYDNGGGSTWLLIYSMGLVNSIIQ